MALRRTVYCPQCNAPKVTQAAARMRLKCAACEYRFRAPAVDDDVELPEGLTSPPTSSDVAASATDSQSGGGGVTVVRARPKVPAAAVDPVADEDPVPGVEKPPALANAKKASRRPGPTPEEQQRAQVAGRKGGLSTSTYNRMVRRDG